MQNSGLPYRPFVLVLTPTAVFSGEGFEVIVLGASGGIQDGNSLVPISYAPTGIATPLPAMQAVWSTA